jgi:hypothetical protein
VGPDARAISYPWIWPRTLRQNLAQAQFPGVIMTTVSIVQPYLFPYLGYIQILAAVDTFVVFDTAQFIRRGWIHRNRILLDGAAYPFTLPVVKAPQDTLIKDIELAAEPGHRKKLLRTMEQTYRSAPRYAEVMPLVEAVLNHPTASLNDLLRYQFEQLQRLVGWDTTLVWASERSWTPTEAGPETRILGMVQDLGADRYINPAGGVHLYDPEVFRQAGVDLQFHHMDPVHYPQGNHPYVSHLSIIDVLMWNPPEALPGLLAAYRLRARLID